MSLPYCQSFAAIACCSQDRSEVVFIAYVEMSPSYALSDVPLNIKLLLISQSVTSLMKDILSSSSLSE